MNHWQNEERRKAGAIPSHRNGLRCALEFLMGGMRLAQAQFARNQFDRPLEEVASAWCEQDLDPTTVPYKRDIHPRTSTLPETIMEVEHGHWEGDVHQQGVVHFHFVGGRVVWSSFSEVLCWSTEPVPIIDAGRVAQNLLQMGGNSPVEQQLWRGLPSTRERGHRSTS